MRRGLFLWLLFATHSWSYGDGISVANWPSSYPGACNVTNWPPTYPVTGNVNVGNLPSVQAVSGSVNVSNFPTSASTASVTRVAVGPISGTLAVANASRRKLIIFNETGTLRVKLGPNASATDYTYEILASAGNNKEVIEGYSGIVTGIKVSGNTFAQVTEF